MYVRLTIVDLLPEFEHLLIGWRAVIYFVQIKSIIGECAILQYPGTFLHEYGCIVRGSVKLGAKGKTED